MQAEVQTPCVIAGPASDVSSMTTPPSVADDMATEIESPARAVNPYTRAKLVGLCGAEQSRVVSESRSSTSGVIETTRHGCTTNSTGTSAGLPRAFSAVTSSVSRYTPAARPRGLEGRCSFGGGPAALGLTESQCSAGRRETVQRSV